MRKTLFEKSIEIILKNQSPIGAYIASPNFDSYRYCWIRDGSYIAYAMDLVGQHQSAVSFHEWVAGVVLSRKNVIEELVCRKPLAKIKKGIYLHTRFTIEGDEAEEDWPNFQLDGFGTWLWSLVMHTKFTKTLPDEKCLLAAKLVAKYLISLWQTPCYDLWEEHPDSIHPYTLACIYGGLRNLSEITSEEYSRETEVIKQYILDHYLSNGYISKFKNDGLVDASLIGLSVPYGLLAPEHPFMQATIAQIEKQLVHGGGVHRYSEDSYYGGGEWVLLSAWLGWYYTQTHEYEKATRMMQWIEEQSDPELNLPEQVPHSLNYPEMYAHWEQRWGKIAKPLLWSHAKYIILSENINSQYMVKK